MANQQYAWDAAFVAFCNGSDIEEIAQVFHIPLQSLKQRVLQNGWRGLRAKLPLVTNSTGLEMIKSGGGCGLPAKVEARMALIEANRTRNLKVFEDARDHLVEQVIALKEKRLKVEKVFCTKGVITRAACDPGPGDWVNIASYANQIAQGTYRALGDMAAQDKPSQDAAAGQAHAPQGPAITIILPGAVAQPREQRSLNEAKDAPPGQVIDVAAVVARQPESGQP